MRAALLLAAGALVMLSLVFAVRSCGDPGDAETDRLAAERDSLAALADAAFRDERRSDSLLVAVQDSMTRAVQDAQIAEARARTQAATLRARIRDALSVDQPDLVPRLDSLTQAHADEVGALHQQVATLSELNASLMEQRDRWRTVAETEHAARLASDALAARWEGRAKELDGFFGALRNNVELAVASAAVGYAIGKVTQ